VAEGQPLQVFVEKWLAAQPEMRLLEVFCPPPQRTLLRAWGALLHELGETCLELADPNVARTKLAWWAQDLGAGAGGRHPLSLALFGHAAAQAIDADAWRRLALSGVSLLDSDHQPSTVDAALAEIEPLAQAIAGIEGRLFGQATNPRDVAVHLQCTRSLRGLLGSFPERTRLPRDLPGDGPGPVALRAYAVLLAGARAPAAGGGLLAQMRRAADGRRLQVLAEKGDPVQALAIAPWRALGLAWRAGRRAHSSL